MIRVNLIPRRRLERQRFRRRSWRWIATVGLYASSLAVAFIVTNAVGLSDDHEVRSELAEARRIVASSELSLSTLRDQLDQAAKLYFANIEVGNQPDWGVLLALLAKTADDEIVFRGCRMAAAERLPDSTDAPADAQKQRKGPRGVRVRIDLDGIARTQQSVTDFLLRLEKIALFRDVKLQDTRREPFLDSHAVAFGVGFSLDAAGESK